MYLNKSIATLDEIADSAKNANLANLHSPRKVSYFELKSAREPPNLRKKYVRRRIRNFAKR
jgi:hypothetical protein